MTDKKILVNFYWNCGRSGDVYGTFSTTEEELSKNYEKNVYFGEILGKHSEIYGILEKKDITILTDDQDFINKAINYGLIPCGYNPLEYITE